MTKPLVFRAHGYINGSLIWTARRFRPGSRPNEVLYAISDRVTWRRVRRWWTKDDQRSRREA